jgi:hypothetical protein
VSPISPLNNIIKRIDNELLFTNCSPQLQQIKTVEKINSNHTTYAELKYDNKQLNKGDSVVGDKLLCGLKLMGLKYEVFSGSAIKERLNYNMEIYLTKDPIFKIISYDTGFSMEYRPDVLYGEKSAYILFFKRDINKQGNFFEFKKFILQHMKPLLFEHCDYRFIAGKAIWSSNSEIRYTHKGDWRTKRRKWNGQEVSGLQFAYLLMGFRPLPSDKTGEILVLSK